MSYTLFRPYAPSFVSSAYTIEIIWYLLSTSIVDNSPEASRVIPFKCQYYVVRWFERSVGGSLQPDGLWGRNIYRRQADKPMGVVLEVTKEFNQEKK
jgi:hypothetical protein